MIQDKEWYVEWFNTPYYHLLYSNRNEEEARHFISNLVSFLKVDQAHKILDLACGKGRHSIYLNKLGFDVMGVDLSKSNIAHANWFNNDRLKFKVHDMRHVVKENHFDFVLNLFTSFGYFTDDKDNEVAMIAAAKNLKSGGKMVLDFMNSSQVVKRLVKEEEKLLSDVHFRISRDLIEGHFIKNITISDDGVNYNYQERVKAITEQDFRRYFEVAGLEVVELFGDYDLAPFNLATSERMIFIVKKP